jgi:hypothetical protein
VRNTSSSSPTRPADHESEKTGETATNAEKK